MLIVYLKNIYYLIRSAASRLYKYIRIVKQSYRYVTRFEFNIMGERFFCAALFGCAIVLYMYIYVRFATAIICERAYIAKLGDDPKKS